MIISSTGPLASAASPVSTASLSSSRRGRRRQVPLGRVSERLDLHRPGRPPQEATEEVGEDGDSEDARDAHEQREQVIGLERLIDDLGAAVIRVELLDR